MYMYGTDRCQTKAWINVSALWGRRYNKVTGTSDDSLSSATSGA